MAGRQRNGIRPGGNKAATFGKAGRRGKGVRNDAGPVQDQISSSTVDRGALLTAVSDRGALELRGATSAGWRLPFLSGLNGRVIR